MDSYAAWNKFAVSGKIEDYLVYRKSCADTYQTIGETLEDADQNRRNSNQTTKNQ